MFERMGTLAARYRFAIILGWIALAVVLVTVAPDLEAVSTTRQEDLLPTDAPFADAQQVYKRAFPARFSPSSTMVLIDAGEGGDVRTLEVWSYIARLEAWLKSEGSPRNISTVSGPTSDPRLAGQLVAPNGRIALVSIALTSEMDTTPTADAVSAIDAWISTNRPADVTVYQTGEAALNTQAEEVAMATMDRTLLITLVLVIVALLAIYRSPVSPLIPFFTVTVAFLVAVALVSILADMGVITVISDVATLLVVVMYGAGTDYCLFLISRFREEMATGKSVAAATKHTVHMVGETISSSAGTIFVGFVSLTFARMGAYKSTGPMLAIGVAVMLLAGLTLAPALLAALGSRAFWPGKASHRPAGRLYEATSKLVSARPLLTIVVIVALMLPFSVYGLAQQVNYNLMAEMPENIPAVQGYDLMQEQMGGGNLFPLTVIATGRDANTLALEVPRLTEQLVAVPGVRDVRGLNTPLGKDSAQMTNLLRVDSQLLMLAGLIKGDPAVTSNPQRSIALLGGTQRYLDLLAQRFPQIANDPSLALARQITNGGSPSLATRQGELLVALGTLSERFKSVDSAYLLPPTAEGEIFASLKAVGEAYVNADRTAYRLDVVLDDPLSEAAMDTVTEIRSILSAYQTSGEVVVSGLSAMYTDLRDIMSADQMRSLGIIIAGIFVVLLLMLRSLVAPLYLIGTVLLSFTCTLGLTNLAFRYVAGVERLSWMMPMFMFVFLVALGVDYSIFLFGRIKEEVRHHGPREGVHVAVAATGAIISSAGIILAGTFGGLMAGDLLMLKQLGFAVSVGVLIDTFVVRTVLDPALAALFGRWTWWPGGVPHMFSSEQVSEFYSDAR